MAPAEGWAATTAALCRDDGPCLAADSPDSQSADTAALVLPGAAGGTIPAVLPAVPAAVDSAVAAAAAGKFSA